MEASSDQLRTLAAVVEHGTFDRAAGALHLTPSAVSQRIKALEELSGRVLVRRSKPIQATAAGAVLVRLARQVALLEAEAAAELEGDATEDGVSAPTSIPLVVNADSLATQEHTIGRLRDGTAMAAIGSDHEPVQGCTVSALGSMRYRPLASPAFVERWCADGWDARVAAVAPMLVYDRKDALQDRYLDRFAPGVRPPRQYVPASTEFLGAAALGLGWGMIPDLQARPFLDDGRLVVLDEGGAVDVPLYWQQWSLQSAALGAVAAAIARAAATALRPA